MVKPILEAVHMSKIMPPGREKHDTKNEVFHEGFPKKIWPNPQIPVHLITFTEEIVHEKLHFLCCEKFPEIPP